MKLWLAWLTFINIYIIVDDTKKKIWLLHKIPFIMQKYQLLCKQCHMQMWHFHKYYVQTVRPNVVFLMSLESFQKENMVIFHMWNYDVANIVVKVFVSQRIRKWKTSIFSTSLHFKAATIFGPIAHCILLIRYNLI